VHKRQVVPEKKGSLNEKSFSTPYVLYCLCIIGILPGESIVPHGRMLSHRQQAVHYGSTMSTCRNDVRSTLPGALASQERLTSPPELPELFHPFFFRFQR